MLANVYSAGHDARKTNTRAKREKVLYHKFSKNYFFLYQIIIFCMDYILKLV